MAPPREAQLLIDDLERSLIRGRARWVADLNEFFRGYQVKGTEFDLYARGRTRNRGFFLSRFFAWTALPDYSVSLFCAYESSGAHLTVEKLRRRMEAVSHTIREDELKWAWLIVLSNRELSPEVVSFVSRYDRNELGLGVASTKSKQMVFSSNQVGRSIGKHLRLRKLLGGSYPGETD